MNVACVSLVRAGAVLARPHNNALKQTKPAIAEVALSSLLNAVLGGHQGGVRPGEGGPLTKGEGQ